MRVAVFFISPNYNDGAIAHRFGTHDTVWVRSIEVQAEDLSDALGIGAKLSLPGECLMNTHPITEDDWVKELCE